MTKNKRKVIFTPVSTFTKYIQNEEHYSEVIARIAKVREDFDRFKILATDLERVMCPRVHFKMMIFDLETAYIGSANLTGAGIGMKSSLRRNFEAGILTNDPELVQPAIEQFDTLWMGSHCKNCGRQEFCGDRIK